jgi:subtilisin-like proprotein convertase family protein
MSVQLVNNGGATALNLQATVATATSGVTITQGSSAYPSLGSSGGSAVNITPFTFTLAPNAACGLRVDFTMTLTFSGNGSPQEFRFSVQTGKASDKSKTVKFTGPPVAIPDDDPNGVNIPINVTGIKGNLANLKFLIAGKVCSADAGATGVGIDHTFVGDLVLKLTSPQGTTVAVINRPGSGTFGSSGNNFCKTLLDDSATDSIEDIISDGAPYSGTFKPSSPLAAFVGENPNGTWNLNVSDNAGGDIGNVRAFSLINTGFSCK